MRSFLPLSAIGACTAFALAADARADEPRFELGGKVEYVTPPIRGGLTPFGAGFGGRLGLVASGIYAGVSVVDFLGGTDADVSDRAILYGVELGYGFRFVVVGDTELVVRPLVGLGSVTLQHTDPSMLGAGSGGDAFGGRTNVDVVSSASGSSATTTVNNLYVEPALGVMLASGAHFAAIGGTVLVLPGVSYGGADPTTWLSYGLSGQVGFRF